MKGVIFVVVCATILQITASKVSNCQNIDLIDEAEDKCNTTDYESYVECIRTLRVKRSTDCQNNCESGDCESSNNDTCNQCDCDSCSYSSCQGSCDNCCSNCCENFVPCRTNHCCHKTCHAECKTSSCRSSCRKSCYETVNKETEKETIIERIFESGSGGGSVNSTSINQNVQNITTVINLKNVINNTNIVDVPINLNYTNQNNISLAEGNEEISFGSDKNSSNLTQDNCCIVIGPKQCTQTDKYPFVKCFHTRSKQCGPYCAASIVHQEEREVCLQSVTGQTTNCKNQVLYIPQPQPKCTYQSSWPYVSCGIQSDKPVSCEGCYKHYVQNDAKEYKTCPAQCYDDGFGSGSYYRQGPFYQPAYSHTPPCSYIPGGCGGFGGYGGYGGYGGNYGYGMPPMGMPSMGMPPMGMQPVGVPMGPYGLPMGTPYGFAPPPMIPNWVPENNTELIGDTKENSTELFNPVINLMPIPYPYYPSYPGPPRDVEIEVAVEPNQPNAQLRANSTYKEAEKYTNV